MLAGIIHHAATQVGIIRIIIVSTVARHCLAPALPAPVWFPGVLPGCPAVALAIRNESITASASSSYCKWQACRYRAMLVATNAFLLNHFWV
jgi:hypothetical protein